MIDPNYAPQFEEDDNEKMKSKNKVSPALVIGITIGVFVWMLLCL